MNTTGSTADQDQAVAVAQLSSGPVEYRLDRRGARVVMVLHGGHCRATVTLGEDVFTGAGYTILAPSRPGYGATPIGTDTTPDGFADTLAELCRRLGIDQLAAVVGQSGGGPTAVAFAARHPGLVPRVILQSSVGLLPWPDRWTRIAAGIGFGPRTGRFTWAVMHQLVRTAPGFALRVLLRDLSTRPVAEVLRGLDPADRSALLSLFGRMRSGDGFRNDVRQLADMATTRRRAGQAAGLGQPVLIIASRSDGAVPYAHAESLNAAIPNAHLHTSTAPSHMIWHGDDQAMINATIRQFLTGEIR